MSPGVLRCTTQPSVTGVAGHLRRDSRLRDGSRRAFLDIGGIATFDLTGVGLDADLDDAIENGDLDPGDAGDPDRGAAARSGRRDSPAATGRLLLVVGNEVSGTTTLYEASLQNTGNKNGGGNGNAGGTGTD